MKFHEVEKLKQNVEALAVKLNEGNQQMKKWQKGIVSKETTTTEIDKINQRIKWYHEVLKKLEDLEKNLNQEMGLLIETEIIVSKRKC